MENVNKINNTNAKPNTSRHAGKSTDELLAEALGTGPIVEVEAPVFTAAQASAPEKLVDKVTAIPTVQAAPAADILAMQAAVANPPRPIQPISTKNTANLISVNELYAHRTPKTETFTLNNKPITITLNGDYDTLAKAVGIALNIILDSGDNYIFSPNRTIIGSLVFLREVTNLNLEFLCKPEISVSQLNETYDILQPLIKHIENIEDADFESYRSWFNRELNASIKAAVEYQHSAKGIVDTLAAHNIKNQTTMTEQLVELNDDKLSQVIDFMQKTEPKKK